MKKVPVTFKNSGGSGFGKAVENLKDSALGADIVEGAVLNGIQTEKKLKGFAEKY